MRTVSTPLGAFAAGGHVLRLVGIDPGVVVDSLELVPQDAP
jgi:hypothetical protein